MKIEELEKRIEALERREKDKRNRLRIRNNINARLQGHTVSLLRPEDLE